MSPVLLSRVSGGQGVASLASFKRNLGSNVGGPLYVEDVFSTYLYHGTNTGANPIANGIDLAGEGGMVWIKARDGTPSHAVFDTERGVRNLLGTDLASAAFTYPSGFGLTSFDSTGFTVTDNYASRVNANLDYASWTFRKAPGFFDIVTYTGNGDEYRWISHNLGSVPGCVIIKRTDNGYDGNWMFAHAFDTDIAGFGGNTWSSTLATFTSTNLTLNSSDGTTSSVERQGCNRATSTEFRVFQAISSTLPDYGANIDGATYVAYLFAHDDQRFGDNADQSIIKCGSYEGTGVAGDLVTTLGWEPQWLLVKNSTSTGNWVVFDNMRNMSLTSRTLLYPNLTNAEFNTTPAAIYPLPNGFGAGGANLFFNQGGSPRGDAYTYIAIRRGPMKTPTDATTVFDLIARTGTGSATTITTNIDSDFAWTRRRAGTNNVIVDRLRGNYNIVNAERTNTESNNTNFTALSGNATNNTFALGTDSDVNGNTYTYINYFLKRAPGFFDVVAYQGTGVAHTESHNLGVKPEMMIIRHRNVAGQHWCIYHDDLGPTTRMRWNLPNGAGIGANFFNNTDPTSSVFTVGTDDEVNNASSGYVAYLFATVPGVSKVGSYTGTGTTLNIDCGFTSGARFVMVKRTDTTSTGWFVWDTERGIVSGDDPYILVNSIDPVSVEEVTGTDFIDPYSAGFTMTGQAPNYYGNVSGGSYIFLAIA